MPIHREGWPFIALFAGMNVIAFLIAGWLGVLLLPLTIWCVAFFRDPANRRRETREWNGRPRSFYSFTHDGHEIWGATAAIIVDLVTRLDGIDAP